MALSQHTDRLLEDVSERDSEAQYIARSEALPQLIQNDTELLKKSFANAQSRQKLTTMLEFLIISVVFLSKLVTKMEEFAEDKGNYFYFISIALLSLTTAGLSLFTVKRLRDLTFVEPENYPSSFSVIKTRFASDATVKTTVGVTVTAAATIYLSTITKAKINGTDASHAIEVTTIPPAMFTGAFGLKTLYHLSNFIYYTAQYALNDDKNIRDEASALSLTNFLEFLLSGGMTASIAWVMLAQHPDDAITGVLTSGAVVAYNLIRWIGSMSSNRQIDERLGHDAGTRVSVLNEASRLLDRGRGTSINNARAEKSAELEPVYQVDSWAGGQTNTSSSNDRLLVWTK